MFRDERAVVGADPRRPVDGHPQDLPVGLLHPLDRNEIVAQTFDGGLNEFADAMSEINGIHGRQTKGGPVEDRSPDW